MPDDLSTRAAGARRRYAEAVLLRDALTPGDPGYKDAVHEVGLRWAQARYWERRIGAGPATTRQRPPVPGATQPRSSPA